MKPYPENSEQALFLAYQYLGAHQADKALAVLNDCEKRLGGLSGRYQELQFLSWIIDKLPEQMEKQSDEVTLATPQVIACQLKALSLATQFKSQGHPFVKAERLTISQKLNKGFHQKLQQAVQDFDTTLTVMYINCLVTIKKFAVIYHQDSIFRCAIESHCLIFITIKQKMVHSALWDMSGFN